MTGMLSGTDLPALDPQAKSCQTGDRGLLALATGITVIAAFYLTQQVLIPLTLAILLSFVLSPVVDLLERVRLWRGPAVIVTVLAALGMISAAATLIGGQAAGLAGDAPRYAHTIEAKIANTERWTTRALARFTPLPAGATSSFQPASVDASAVTAAQVAAQPLPVRVTNERSSPYWVIKSIVGPILAPLETVIIVLVVSIFILLQKEDLRDRFVRLFGSADPERTGRAMEDAGLP